MSTKNTNLNRAKAAKDDEFYTQLKDIEKQMSLYLTYNPDVFKDKIVLCPCDDPTWSNFTRFFIQNFKRIGLRKLISTCISPASLNMPHSNLLEPDDAPQPYVEMRGKKMIVTYENIDEINPDDVCFEYLQGSGDYASAEITRLRDEADFIITNPPFSLFRDIFMWCMDARKQFCLLGTINAVGYHCVFPYIKVRSVRLGSAIRSGGLEFRVVRSSSENNRIDYDGNIYAEFSGLRWFSTIPEAFVPPMLELRTMQENIENNAKLKGTLAYQKYDEVDAIEIPYTDAIPSDYDGVMGVPVTFFDKWNPEQFEIVSEQKEEIGIGGQRLYARFLIRRLS